MSCRVPSLAPISLSNVRSLRTKTGSQGPELNWFGHPTHNRTALGSSASGPTIEGDVKTAIALVVLFSLI